MGNNASSPKTPGTPGHEGSSTTGSANTGSSRPVQYHQQLQQQQLQQSQQQQQKGARNPAVVQSQRSAAPPEPSMAHAQGSTASSASRSIPSRPYGTTAAEVAAAASASPSRAPAKQQRNTPPPPSKPVNVPQPSSSSAAGTGTAKIPIAPPANVIVPSATGGVQVPAGAVDFEPPLSPYADSMDVPVLTHNSMPDVSYLTRPPRLPLPIEEEVHTPGSPIIAPRKDGDPVDDIEALDNDGGLTHRSSTLSSATIEEEDMEELRVDKTRPTVPTRLEWLRGGEKVYVTGTIFQWNKKQRMHPVEGRPGVFATTINVLPGTHHIRFLVDNQMETSRDLPTTVDFGNNLVNYIEVAPQSTPPKDQQGVPSPAATTATGAPVSAPGVAATAPAVGSSASGSKQQQQQQSSPQDPNAQQKQTAQARAGASLIGADSSVQLTDRAPKWKNVPEPSAFSHELPKFLVDYDQPDDSPDFHTAAAATEILPMPPSLPGFLGKPILNAATLIKDDNSVLNMPNYTILNHLATSSIKNNILAVSATTRYKDKFTTIIIYKPTGGDDVKR
ncbi:galactose metabolism-related protein [Sporothrix eucalyptigena]|uniref:Galactose metabolism-related protein n=1 Tax=Sporothrix eucalyptigena TaxID=1812306 RepID=A0ABP0AYH4_9PEZI